jgi:hypothetical protein
MIQMGEQPVRLRKEVVEHFRDVNSISGLNCKPRIKLLIEEFDDRNRAAYLEVISRAIKGLDRGPAAIFLDPDTGLQPESGSYNDTHVLSSEIRAIWDFLRAGDVLVLYQHQDNRAAREWIERKRLQFACALRLEGERAKLVKLAYAPDIAKDVAFYFIEKNFSAGW